MADMTPITYSVDVIEGHAERVLAIVSAFLPSRRGACGHVPPPEPVSR